MYPDSFDYHRAGSVEEALSLLDEHADKDATLLSGGHSLVPTMKSGLASPDVIIDIGSIDELSGVDLDGDQLHVGASTRYATVVDNTVVDEHAPVFGEAAGEIGDTQVRNRGTVGGNIAHADPASDLPAVMVATDATIHAQGPDGHRSIDADDFFLGVYMTALTPDEILTGIDIPSIGDGIGAYVKKPSPSSGYAMIGVAARLQTDGDTITNAGVAANGAMDRPIRLASVEAALEGSHADADVIAEAATEATTGFAVDEFMADIQADHEYRAQLLEVYTRRALTTSLERL